MSVRCRESWRVQDLLDDLLPPAERDAFRRHAGGCPVCTAELAAYASMFHTLDALPLTDPGPAFTTRVLDAVLPSSIRRRWLRTVGWTYAASLAASAVAAIAVVNLPAWNGWLDAAATTASRHTVQLMMFLLNLAGYATLGIANGWGLIATMGARIAPLPRALVSLLQHPPVEIALWGAAIICIAVLWLLHGRDRATRRVDPLALIGV